MLKLHKIILSCISVSLAGCVQLTSPLQPPTANVVVTSQPDSVVEYITYARMVEQASTAEKKALLAESRSAFRRSPTPDNRLRLAVALQAIDGGRERLAYAKDLLNIFERPETKATAAERAFALTQRTSISQRLTLMNKINKLELEVENIKAAYKTARAAREDTKTEIINLNAALESAEAKLKALTTIEQSMERPLAKTLVP